MWGELRVIIWKNLLIKKRHWFLTLVEILLPTLLFTLVAYAKSQIKEVHSVYEYEAAYEDYYSEENINSHLDVGELNLWYAPRTDFTENLMISVQHKFQIRGDAVKAFPSKETLLQNIDKNCSHLLAVVIFSGNYTHHLNYDLTIYDKCSTWNTNLLYTSGSLSSELRSSQYIDDGYAALQLAIGKAFLELQNADTKDVIFRLQEFPSPPNDSQLNQLVLLYLPLVTMFTFMFLCPAVLQRVGEEKSSGIMEYMKIVGLNSWVIWLGWLIHALTTNIFSIFIIVGILKLPIWGSTFVENSDGSVLFVFLLLYCISAVTFCFVIGSFFDSPAVSTVFGVLVWIFSYFIPHFVLKSRGQLPWSLKIPFAMLPNPAMYFGYSCISDFEMRGVGVQWHNLFKSGTGNENDISLGNIFVMFILNTFVFMIITLYIENVQPGKYGIAKPYNFFLKELCQFGRKILRGCCLKGRVEHSPENMSLHNEDIELGKIPCIRIRKLYKKYYNHLAVENLSMDVYRGHITVLLGQNGAGKTTTMAVLTGMINASSGTVTVNGIDIKRQTNAVRKLIGLCPQHDLLFPTLTLKEHLQFFAKLKGSSDVEKDAKEMINNLGLNGKENCLVNTLSGGMKRKLCLGIALIGNSEVLILDEPTSSMDPESRRKIWNLLLGYRRSKTILISTHFMEEADVLGEYIAIMANGHLQCYGTPTSLKEKYNTGYHFSLLLDSKDKVPEITRLFQNHFPDVKLFKENEDSVTFLLPIIKNQKYKYGNLIGDLEQNQDQFHIVAINLNETTLNDVFLKAKDESDGKSGDEVDGIGSSVNEFSGEPTLQGLPRLINSFVALVSKRWYFIRRKFYWYFPATLVSVIIFLMAIWLSLASYNHQTSGGPPINFTLDIYQNSKVYVGVSNSSTDILVKMKNTYGSLAMRQNGQPEFHTDALKEIIKASISNVAFYKKYLIVAVQFSQVEDKLVVNAMFSSEALQSVPVSMNLALNAIAKTFLNESFGMSVGSTPIQPETLLLLPSQLYPEHITSVWLTLVPLSIFFFLSNFILFPNSEISTGFAQLQFISGVKTYFYWVTNVVIDVLLATVFVALLLFLIYAQDFVLYNSEAFQTTDIFSLVAILLLCMFGSLPYIYLLSHRNTITSGFTLLIMFGIILGIIPTLVIMVMEYSSSGITKYLRIIFLILSPQFTVCHISTKFARKYVGNYNWRFMDLNKKNYICHSAFSNPCCKGEDTSECAIYADYFRNPELGVGQDLILLMASFIIYFALLCSLNTEVFKKIAHFFKYFKIPKRASSYRESRTMNDHVERNKSLRVKNLTKSFGEKVIIKNLKFYLSKNKCLGLLGVNGAGKTTTFRILTKSLFYDKGEVDILHPPKTQISIKDEEYCYKIGYCPQEDCLNYFLTARELLFTMACLKGYSRSKAREVTNNLLKCFGLTQYDHKPCLEYSGGNKRKLSSCLAFLGAPNVILLDEPTNGVDPAARRKFWNILSSFKTLKDTSFLLCSHSMEECENLCDEIAIMKNGEIKEQGTLLALKNKYHKGFKITLKLSTETKDAGEMEAIENRIEDELEAEILEKYAESLTFQVKESNKQLSELFFALENLKNEHKIIEDYAINQISLEDIFLNLAEQEC